MNKTQLKPTMVSPLVASIVFAALMILATGSALAQTPSTDRDNPTALTSNTITSDGVDEKTEYFYTFTAGPGDVTVTLDVKAEKSTAVSSVDIALYDAKSKRLLSTFANPDHGSSKRAVETVKVRGTQALLLEVTVSPGVDTFKIKLDGAVVFASTTGEESTPTTDAALTADTQQTQPVADGSAAGDATATGVSGTTATGSGENTTVNDGSAAQTGTASGASAATATKVNQKVNSAAAKLSAVISNASATANSAKPAKKKKP
ncbi:MAG TPA: hypothetical protein VHR36_04430 [Pyrinomonadaceae bacterium]|nr:hypothetical protein [Pyrinomonadaceae bacterium]